MSFQVQAINEVQWNAIEAGLGLECSVIWIDLFDHSRPFSTPFSRFGHSSTTFDETLKGLEKASESFMLKVKILDPRYNKYKQYIIYCNLQ